MNKMRTRPILLKELERLQRYCSLSNLYTKCHFAQTGTVYLTIESKEKTIVVRISDHADAYGTSDYTIDDIEGTFNGAIEFIETCLNVKLKKKQHAVTYSKKPCAFTFPGTGDLYQNERPGYVPARLIGPDQWQMLVDNQWMPLK